MVSNDTRREIEETLGQVPSFMDDVADAASDHSWGIFRDLQMGADTDLSPARKPSSASASRPRLAVPTAPTSTPRKRG